MRDASARFAILWCGPEGEHPIELGRYRTLNDALDQWLHLPVRSAGVRRPVCRLVTLSDDGRHGTLLDERRLPPAPPLGDGDASLGTRPIRAG